MNLPWIRPGHVAAAALLIGGVLVISVPQYAATVLRLMVVSVAAAAALYAIEVIAPPRWWRSPFPARRRRTQRASTADELDWIRALISGPRQRLDGAVPLPPELVRMLQSLGAEAGATTAGVSGGDPDATIAAVPWYRLLPPAPRTTARAVLMILDDIERRAAQTSLTPVASETTHESRT
jgi:hypothetical protein